MKKALAFALVGTGVLVRALLFAACQGIPEEAGPRARPPLFYTGGGVFCSPARSSPSFSTSHPRSSFLSSSWHSRRKWPLLG